MDVDEEQRRPVVVLGHEVADKLFESADPIGQVVRLGAASGSRSSACWPRKGRVLGQSFDAIALIPLSRYEMIYGHRASTSISVKMAEAADVAPGMARAEEAMRLARGTCGRARRTTSPWRRPRRSSPSGRASPRCCSASFPAVVAIGVVVGGIVIMNIMLMAVSERTREIGIPQGGRRAGARHRAAVPRRSDRALDARRESSACSPAGRSPSSSQRCRRCRRASRGGRWCSPSFSAPASACSSASIPRDARRGSIPSTRCEPNDAPLSIDQLRENIGIALDALRVSKLRSGLTILGVVIGVATVMTMATIVKGFATRSSRRSALPARRPST